MFSQVAPHSGCTSVFTHQRVRQTLEMELLRWKLIAAVLCPSENFRPKVLWIWQLKILVVVADTANAPSPSPPFATG